MNAPTKAVTVNPIVELHDTHVIHKARSGGVFTRDRVYSLTGADLAVRPGETVGAPPTPRPTARPRRP